MAEAFSMPADEPRIKVVVRCADCDATLEIPWPLEQYWSTLNDEITLDGKVIAEGWWTQPGSIGGDNILRCPKHRTHEDTRRP